MAETTSVLTDEIKALIGVTGDKVEASLWGIEREDLRRFTQAIMDPDPRYWDEALPPNASSRVRTRVSLGGAAQDDVQGVTEWDVEPGGKAEITYTISVD